MYKIEDIRNTIIQGDSLEILKNIPDNSIDAIITDPPYNIGDGNKLCKQGSKIKSNKEMWGNIEPKNTIKYYEYLKKVFKEFYRVNKGSIIIFYNRLEITLIKDMLKDAGFYPKNLLCIVKKNSLPHFRKNGFRSDFELALYCQKNKGKDIFNFINQNTMKSIDYYTIGKKYTTHPTEKPLLIIEKYVKIISNKSNIILDPFIGSGTTAVACERLQRNWIGIEREQAYIDIANARINKYKYQTRLI